MRERFGDWNRGGGRTPGDVFYDPELGRWVVAGYAAALRVFEQRGSDAPDEDVWGFDLGDPLFAQAQAILSTHLFFQRSPNWERLRRVLMQPLSVGATAALGPSMADIARDLVAAARDRGRFEVMGDLARPLIFRTQFALIGAAASQHEALVRLAEASRMIFELKPTTFEVRGALLAFAGLCRAMETLLFREPPVDTDMMRGVRAAVADGVWSREEALSTLAVMVIAGLNSPINAIGSLFYNLATTPEAWAAAKAGTLSRKAIVAETLRLGPPSLAVPKAIVQPMTFEGGVVLEPPQRVLVLVGRANRDPTVFAEPDRFDPWRPLARNLAFGAGRHKCPGKHLAAVQLDAALAAALERLPTLTLAAEPERTASVHGERAFARLELGVQ
jgi:cytochrome P450